MEEEIFLKIKESLTSEKIWNSILKHPIRNKDIYPCYPCELRFTDDETGYECLIVRGRGGQLNGYVVVPEGHYITNTEMSSPFDCRNIEYVESECKKLARQLKTIEENKIC